MRPRLDLLTLAVPDLAAARRYYLDGLGWTPALDLPGEVLFLQLNAGLLVALLGAGDLAADLGLPPEEVVPGVGFTLAHNVASPEEVRAVVARAEAAGARVLKTPQPAAFGGFHGYVADPAGLRWEVAFNPGWHVAPDGTVTIAPVAPDPAG